MKRFYAKIPAAILNLTDREAVRKYADAASVCEVFRLNRIMTTEILNNLPDDAFDRVALHPEMGEFILGTLMHVYAYHVHHHVNSIETKKRMIVGQGAPEGSPT